MFIQRAPSEKTTVADALHRYEREIVPTKKASTQRREGARIRELKTNFGKYSLAAVTPDLVGRYRDDRLAQGKANNTVRLELALLGHLFSVAIKEWHIGLVYNPVANIRKPRPGEGRNRRLSGREQALLLTAVDKHTNPMLGWIVRLTVSTDAAKAEAPRRKHQPIRVWCLPEEKAQVEANARKAGLSVSSYLRNVGMGYVIQGVIDAELVRQLAKINGDQGRLGGLLKLWLTNSEKLGSQDPDQMRRVIHGILDRIIAIKMTCSSS